MTDNHPITPPPELVTQWWGDTNQDFEAVAIQAARWGADTELEACCEWLVNWVGMGSYALHLRSARRPKPPSLKELALAEMELLETEGSHAVCMTTLRRALEALPDD